MENEFWTSENKTRYSINKIPISKVFGDTPKVKVLDTLIENSKLGYSKKGLAEAARISKSTLYKLWDKLEEEEIVQKIGNATLHKLNEDSKIVRELVRFEKRLLSQENSIKI